MPTYFDVPVRAEPIRIALFIVGLPFEDKRLTFPDYPALKEKGAFPLGAVPTLEAGGVVMTQTPAMLRYIAQVGNTTLHPTVAFVVDSAADTFNDTLSHAVRPSFVERDMAKKLEMRAEFTTGPMPKVMRYIEGLLERFGDPSALCPRAPLFPMLAPGARREAGTKGRDCPKNRF